MTTQASSFESLRANREDNDMWVQAYTIFIFTDYNLLFGFYLKYICKIVSTQFCLGLYVLNKLQRSYFIRTYICFITVLAACHDHQI
jgi:hypothetical protein